MSCTHPLIVGKLCGVCGASIDTLAAGQAGGKGASQPGHTAMTKVTMSGGTTVSLSKEEAESFSQDKTVRLLSSRKLSLVLDLDHTLLHATADPRAAGALQAQVQEVHVLTIAGIPGYHYVKLRPGLRHFLQDASKNFDLTIYTAGTRPYAEQIARILDPAGTLFQRRIISSCDTRDLGRSTKSLSRIFPGGISMALIVDDRLDVWRGEQQRHLLAVRPYLYWGGSPEVNNGPGSMFGRIPFSGLAYHQYIAAAEADEKSASEGPEKKDENGKGREVEGTEGRDVKELPAAAAAENDPQLHCLLSILHKVHAKFYGAEETQGGHKNVADLLVKVRQQVLKGVVIVFSGCFPIAGGEFAKQQDHPLWQWAETMGAKVNQRVDASTTHVVAARSGTDKTVQSESMPGVFTVHLDWLLYSVWHSRREPERPYLLTAVEKLVGPSSQLQHRENASGLGSAGGKLEPRKRARVESDQQRGAEVDGKPSSRAAPDRAEPEVIVVEDDSDEEGSDMSSFGAELDEFLGSE
ncbi:unnamed protein product [Chrysoparadoxa australica]